MNNEFSLNLFDDILIDSFTESEMIEYYVALNELDALSTPSALFEVVNDRVNTIRNKAANIIKNTSSTTTDLLKSYDKITDAEGKAIKNTWDLTMTVMDLAIKGITFIIGMISSIPKAINILIKKIAKIPDDVLNKIKGNIKLYITIDDLEMLYNRSLINRLDVFISTLDLLTEGEMWGTFFNTTIKWVNGKQFVPSNNDMALCRKLDSIYKKIENMGFEQTLIHMDDKKTVDAYFSSTKVIKFTDLSGKQHDSTYYEALIQLVKDIESKQSSIKSLQSDFHKKYTAAQANQDFAKLSPLSQNRIAETLQQVSKIIVILGNIMRYVNIDIKTMDKTIEKLLNKK